VADSLGLVVGDGLVFFTAWGLWCTAGALFHKLKLAVADGLELAVGDRGWVGVSQALACENKKYH